MNTFKLTKEHYKKLGGKIASLMNKKRHFSYLRFVQEHFSKDKKILDLACGYGRLTVPLAKKGYNIEGIDLAPNYIRDAKSFAKKEKVDIKFRVGNMCSLPYKTGSFDGLICMWSSFIHLLKISEQKKALKESYRILRPNGLAIFDLPYYGKQENNLRKDVIQGVPSLVFMHDKDSILKALKISKIKKYCIKKEVIGGRKRLIVYIHK